MNLMAICALLAVHFSFVQGGCSETYTQAKTCSRREKYYTRCNIIFTCTRYRNVNYACSETKSRCCENWEGSDCSTPVCHGSTTCPNGGTCQSPNNCSCTSGFASPICTDINECTDSNGGCQQICTNTHGSFKCSCAEGYILDSDQKTCIDVNECYAKTDDCQQKCENLPGTFSCACNEGYVLNNDSKTCRDRDECLEDGNVCQHNCTNTIGSFICSCSRGYIIDLDKISCIDVDECSNIQVCDHQCQNTNGSYTCSCNAGYELQSDGSSCSDNDECGINNGNCQNTCVNIPGSYSCTCPSGYYLNADKHTCDDIDECARGISGCSHRCNNTIGSFECDCPQGFRLTSDNKTCEDINDCAGIECYTGGTCIDAIMSFSCQCREGYTGKLCETDVDECSFFNGGCQDICTNTDGYFQCSCSDNRTLSSNGISCKGTSASETVFKKHNIVGKVLPMGCWTISLAKFKDGKELNITLSSTSEWRLIDSANPTTVSYGIVFLQVNNMAVPISLDGIEVHGSPENFQLLFGVREEYKGKGSLTGNVMQDNCLAFNFSNNDKFEFIEAGSFLNSLFSSMIASLPNWIQFKSTNQSSLTVRDLKTDLIYGSEINNDKWCKGAPVFPNHLYSVFRFGSSFDMDIYGKSINLPSLLSGDKFCFIIDIYQRFGSTVFVMLPKASRGLLSKIPSFKTLFEKKEFYIEPIGIGISLMNGINVHHKKTELALWNGDEIFNYPISKQASFWIGGEMIYNASSSFLHAEVKVDVFLSIPNVNRLLTAVFLDEWSGLITVEATTKALLKFELFGKQYEMILNDIITGRMDIYMSIGGQEERILCGATANPSGIFLSTMLKINPFLNVPILEDWIFDYTQNVYAFFMSDPRSTLQSVVELDIFKDMLDLQGSLERIKRFILDIYDDVKYFMSSNIIILIQNVALTAGQVIDTLRLYLPDFDSNGNLNTIVDIVGEIWKGINVLKNNVSKLMEYAELVADVRRYNVTTFVKTEIEIVINSFNKVQKQLNQQVSNLLKDYDGFGLKFHATITIFGLKFPGLDVEFVYSKQRLFSCSRFDFVYKLLEGKEAARFLGRVSVEKRLGYFLKVDVGVGRGLGIAMAINSSDDVVVQIELFVGILGVKFTEDLFITKKGLALYAELNVWNTFLAQVEVSAEHGQDWYDLMFHVRGRFVAQARKKRQHQTNHQSFQSSYLDALKKAISGISDEAEKRISFAKTSLIIAQNGSTKAQQWLEEKKIDIRRANGAFDDAVESLKKTKTNLEEAKKPYENAVAKLEAVQRKIDNLCKIQACRRICVPGIKCKTCRKKVAFATVSYPCCHFTNCMFSYPEPVCVLANLVCQGIRALAYSALEASKIIVRSVMLVYDAAQLAVLVAQEVVDKSRIVLDLAEGVISLAQVGLEGAKGLLEAAKLALDEVIKTIGVAVKVLEFVIDYGLKEILDVGNCGFAIELLTTDLAVFDISCDVNAFKLGWRTFRIRINFKNVFQSIWQAAKATIKSIMDQNYELFSGRQRRALLFSSTSQVHRFLRNARSADNEGINVTSQAADDVIDTLVFNDGFDADTFSDFDNRVNLFRLKCIDIVKVIAFLNETFSALFDIANETNVGIEESLLAKAQIPQYNLTDMANNMTLQSAGIDIEYARHAYNISETDLAIALNATKNVTFTDPMINEINSIIELSSNGIHSELTAAQSVQILNQWLNVMENTTNAYFNEKECYRFKDCVYFSMALLYELYTEESHPEMANIHSAIISLEDYILDVFQNSTSSIPETFNASASIMKDIQLLSKTNLFCSKAPVFKADMKNYTAVVGSSAVFRCHVYAEPAPTFWWFKDGDYIPGFDKDKITVENVTTVDAAIYQCVAGNIVANISSAEVHLIIITSQPDTEEDNNDVSIMKIILVAGAVLGGVVISTVVTLAIWLIRSKKSRMIDLERRRQLDSNARRGTELDEFQQSPENICIDLAMSHKHDNQTYAYM